MWSKFLGYVVIVPVAILYRKVGTYDYVRTQTDNQSELGRLVIEVRPFGVEASMHSTYPSHGQTFQKGFV